MAYTFLWKTEVSIVDCEHLLDTENTTKHLQILDLGRQVEYRKFSYGIYILKRNRAFDCWLLTPPRYKNNMRNCLQILALWLSGLPRNWRHAILLKNAFDEKTDVQCRRRTNTNLVCYELIFPTVVLLTNWQLTLNIAPNAPNLYIPKKILITSPNGNITRKKRTTLPWCRAPHSRIARI